MTEPLHIPELTEDEERKSEELTSTSAKVIHESIRKEGEQELRRTSSGLAWSGMAAGLSMGFSLLTVGALKASLPHESWADPVAKLGFPAGFLIVIMGRQQLFTENTLTPIIPLLARRDSHTFFNVLRLWAVVFVANLLGTLTVALALTSSIFPQNMRDAFFQVAQTATQHPFWQAFLKAVFAGWLIALVVWILGGIRNGGAHIIFALTYIMGLSGFTHVISGSVDAFFLLWSHQMDIAGYFGFLIPTLLGNIIGGIALVSIANHAQVTAGGGTLHKKVGMV
jgi:formate/nitrite transporter FocA (FNT family)